MKAQVIALATIIRLIDEMGPAALEQLKAAIALRELDIENIERFQKKG